jgi:pimeloyl-ACP methyl ester carboxylesterase
MPVVRANGIDINYALDLLGSISAPTLITFGRHDLITSTRFAEPLTS